MESERMLLPEFLTPTPFLRSIQSAAPALRSIRVGSAYPQAIRQQLNQSRSQSARARSYIKLNASDRHATQKKDTQAATSATNRSCNCKNRIPSPGPTLSDAPANIPGAHPPRLALDPPVARHPGECIRAQSPKPPVLAGIFVVCIKQRKINETDNSGRGKIPSPAKM